MDAIPMFDNYCMTVVQRNLHMTVPWYLMAGTAYEHRDKPIISDACWTDLCSLLEKNWDRIVHHHKHLIKFEDLACKTFHRIRERDIPIVVKNASARLRQDGPPPLPPVTIRHRSRPAAPQN